MSKILSFRSMLTLLILLSSLPASGALAQGQGPARIGPRAPDPVTTIYLPLVHNGASGSSVGAIIVDHNAVDQFAAIPDGYVSAASATRIMVRHASVGYGISWGLDCLGGAFAGNPLCREDAKYDRTNFSFQFRSNPTPEEKVDDLVTQTALQLNSFDAFTMKYCYIDALFENHPDWEYYRSKMEQLEAQYPDKKFVWWTIPLTTDGFPGADWFNSQVRAYAIAHNKVLFDIADIQTHTPAGVRVTNSQGNEICYSQYTDETHTCHLNETGGVRVGKAFWYMMARLAGWSGSP